MSEPSSMDDTVPVPEAVLWDMDGTLVDSEKLWDVALHEAVEWLGGSLSESQRGALVGSNMDSTAAFLLEVVGERPSSAAIDEVSAWIRRRASTLFAGELPWRPGAWDALNAVQSAGIPCALVTSTERELTELALNTIGRAFFQATVCGDEVHGHNKPDPQPYRRAAALLEVTPARCVAVEDSPPGAEAAVAAGCVTLVIPHDVPVEAGTRRVLRSSLVDIDARALAEIFVGESS